MTTLRKAASAATVLVSVAALAACSSSGGSSGTTGGSGSTGAGSGSAVKVGLICSCTGAFGQMIGAAQKAAVGWEKSVNASGGINGHKINLIVKDDASNPSTSVTAAQSMISQHVAVILDMTVLDAAWQKQMDAAKIPVVGGNIGSTQFYSDPNWYPTGQTNDSIVYSVVETAKTAGAKKLGQLYCAEAPQCQESVKPIKQAGDKLGLSVTYSASISATAPNYTAQCVAAKQQGIDALFIGDGQNIIARVATDCDKQGYDPIYITEGTGYTDLALTTPGLKDHLWSEFPNLPYFADSPLVKDMLSAVDSVDASVRKNPNAWSQNVVQTWAGALMIAKAIKDSNVASGKDVSADDITKALNSVSNETLGGWSSPLTYTAGKPHPVDCWYTAKVTGGKAALVNDGKTTCQSS